MTQICVSKFTIIGLDNGLSPIRRQVIIWTNAGILLIRTLGTNFSEMLIPIHTFSKQENAFKNVWKMSAIFLDLNLLIPAWKSNYNNYKVWDEITCPFPNFNGTTVEIWPGLVILTHISLDM